MHKTKNCKVITVLPKIYFFYNMLLTTEYLSVRHNLTLLHNDSDRVLGRAFISSFDRVQKDKFPGPDYSSLGHST